MADVAPWLVPQSTEGKSVAPWLADQPGYAEDIAKSIPSGLAKGVIALPGTPGDLASLAKAGADKVMEKTGAPDPLGWITHKMDQVAPSAMNFFRESNAKSANAPAAQVGSGDLPGSYEMPTSKDIQSGVEKATGPFYEAKTGPGKAVQTTLEVAPSIATGGGGLPGVAVKSIGAGITSELAGEGADAAKGLLPKSAQPYAEPIARAIGTGVGTFAPSMARRVITPLPVNDARLNTINALRQTNPELVNASTAGQLTDSPRLMGIESRNALGQGAAQRQAEGYTQGVMRQAGSDGMFDTPGLAQAKARGGELDALQNAHEMNPSQYGLLNQYAATRNTPGSHLYKEVGPSKAYQDVVDALRNGPGGGNPAPMSMTGPRYGVMKGELQKAGEAAPTPHEGKEIFDLRTRMKNAFQNSMPDVEAQRLRDLDKNYSNYMTIKDIPAKVGQNTVTPNQVFQKAPRGSDLEGHAEQASSIMTPHGELPDKTKVGPMADLLTSILSGAVQGGGAEVAGAGHGLSALIGSEGTVAGHLLAPALYHGAADVGARIASSRPAQAYLGNQAWRPGPNSTTSGADLIRALLAPPDRDAVMPYRGPNLGPMQSK